VSPSNHHTIATIKELCDELARDECVSELADGFLEINKRELEQIYKNWAVLSTPAESSTAHSAMAKMLLALAGDPKIKDKKGRTSISYGAQYLKHDLISLLVRNGADVNEKDDSGRTPFSWVAGCENPSKPVTSFGSPEDMTKAHWKYFHISTTLMRLRESGASLYEHDDSGRTPLSWAAGEGSLGMVRFICQIYDDEDRQRQDYDFLKPDMTKRSPITILRGRRAMGQRDIVSQRPQKFSRGLRYLESEPPTLVSSNTSP
jgi:hypothetical protein